MVSVLVGSVVDHDSSTKRVKTIKFIFVASLLSRQKEKKLVARNQNNVSEWSDMSTGILLFQ